MPASHLLPLCPELLGQPAARHFALEIEALSAEAAALPFIAGNHPEHFELVAVRVLRVEAQAVAVVRLATERSRPAERITRPGEVGQSFDFPSQVVEADAVAAAGCRCLLTDTEETEVVMVVTPICAQ